MSDRIKMDPTGKITLELAELETTFVLNSAAAPNACQTARKLGQHIFRDYPRAQIAALTPAA